MSWRRTLSEVGPYIGSTRFRIPSLCSPPFRYFIAGRHLPCRTPTPYISSIPAHRPLSSIAPTVVVQPLHDDTSPTKDPNNADALFQQIRDATSSTDHLRIHALYQSLLEGAMTVNKVQDVQKEIISSSLGVLALSGKPQDLELIDRILEQMHHHWDFPVTPDVHSVILEGLLKTAEDSTVTRWLLKIPSKPGGWNANQSQWNDFLLRCQRDKKPHLIKSTVGLMRFSGCTPNEMTYTILVHALFRSQLPLPRFSVVREIVKDMQNDQVPFTYAMRDLMTEAYAEHGARTLVRQTTYLHLNTLRSGTSDKDNAMRARQLAIAGTKGLKEAKRLLTRFRKEGFVPSVRTLATAAEGSKTVKDMMFWEGLLEVKANCYVFAVVLKNAADYGNRYAVQELLRVARTIRHLPMTVDMVHPALRLLCTSQFGPPPDKQIDHALELFDQYIHQYDGGTVYSEVVSHTPRDDLPLYNTVIRALTSSTNKKYYGIALSLLEKMQSRGVTSDSMSVASVMVVLLKLARTPSEAYDIYKIACKDHGALPILDPKGYVTVLDAFCKRTLLSKHAEAATQFYFEIVKDMRMAGYPVPIEVYTIILRQLCDRITKLPRDDLETRERLILIVRRIHDFITVDGSLVPDAVLWNELMDTYQRAGCFQDAFRLWQTMHVTRRYDNASVSIILDACAFAGAHDAAVEVYHKILEDGFKFNQKNWNNWLECLCRLGKLDEALKVFCLELGQAKEEGVGPSIQGFRVLMRFSIRTNEESLVRTRVKRYLPELWAELPDHLRGSS